MKFRFLHDFPEDKECCKDSGVSCQPHISHAQCVHLRNTDISDEKIARVPVAFQEYFEAIEDQNDCEEHNGSPGHGWLEKTAIPWV
jgi:hypothetical protein